MVSKAMEKNDDFSSIAEGFDIIPSLLFLDASAADMECFVSIMITLSLSSGLLFSSHYSDIFAS